MVSDKKTIQWMEKQDIFRLILLSAIALVIGVYLIATAVLIAKDGVFYIGQAQKISTNPVGVIKEFPPGYPFLIFAVHKGVVLSGCSSSSIYSWIYCAQSVSLLCRVLAIIPLYFIGKLLVGGVRSFWAVLILILLPAPAQFGSDTLRDWPHILFIAWGMLFLIQGANRGKWWLFGCAGLVSGLGYIVRPECAQIVIYGVLWLAFGLLRPVRHKMNRPKLVGAMLILLLSFTFVAGPYQKIAGLPEKVKELIISFHPLLSQRIQSVNINNGEQIYSTAGLPGNIASAIGKVMNEININLFYFFTPALWIGLYFRFRRESTVADVEKFFVSAFAVFNISTIIFLYCFWKYISTRHCLPLVVFLIFYVPIGLEVLANWLENRLSCGGAKTGADSRRWFFVLLAIGVVICLPKLVRPMHWDKQGFRDAAKWLRENTKKEALIAVPDPRIAFYAERKMLMMYNDRVPEQADYAVRIIKDKDEKPEFGKNTKEEYSTGGGKRKKDRELIVYRVNH